MYIVGIDLSGPSNTDDTVLVAFEARNAELHLQQTILAATDTAILASITNLSCPSEIAVGIDAPLSYNVGGGDRPSDAALRKQTIAAGLHPGSIMPPTMNRMVYLTLRGMSIARLLFTIANGPPRIVEVHPGGAMALRGAPIEAVRSFKESDHARWRLIEWLEGQGLRSASKIENPSDHYVAACAAALAAWKWHTKETAWLSAANAPLHPFDYAC